MCCGSDYPFPLGEMIGGKKYAAGKIIDDADEFDEEDKEKMLVRCGTGPFAHPRVAAPACHWPR